MGAMLTLRNDQILTEAYQSPRDMSVSAQHMPLTMLQHMQRAGPAGGYSVADWQIFVSGLTPLTSKVFQPISFS